MSFSSSYNYVDVYANDFVKSKFFHKMVADNYPIVVHRSFTSDTPVRDLLKSLRVATADPFAWSESPKHLWCAYEAEEMLIYITVNFTGDQQRYYVHLAAHKKAKIDRMMKRLTLLLPEPEIENDGPLVPVRFWSQSSNGPTIYERKIETPSWADIEPNYPGSIRSNLNNLITARPPFEDLGRLAILHGVPGSGKTTFIRALCRSWSSWCETHYVVDPERFFGDSSYMLNVLLTDPFADPDSAWMALASDEETGFLDSSEVEGPEPAWRLLVAEDVDDFLVADARDRSGQALSRLLNLADGLIGQGLNLLLLLTTNQDIRDLHPAIRREGRCFANVHFDLFSPAESEEWLARHDTTPPKSDKYSLAQLFELTREKRQVKTDKTQKQVGQYL